MATSLPLTQAEPESPTLIAPLWHTITLVAFLLVFSALGSGGHGALTHPARVRFYLSTIALEWVMVGYVVWGLRRARRTTVRDLIGGRWNKPEDFLLDLVVAIGFWFAAALVLGGLGYLLGMNNMQTMNEVKRRIAPM